MSFESDALRSHEDDEDAGVPAELLAERDDLSKRLSAVNAKIAAARLSRLKKEPRCPECGAEVLRPKCMYEYGPNCPRHDVVALYGGGVAILEHLQSLPDPSSAGNEGEN